MARPKIYSDIETQIIKKSGGGFLTYRISKESGICVTTIYTLAKMLDKYADHKRILEEIKNESRQK